MPLTVDGGNGFPKQMDEGSEFDDSELNGIALTAFTGGQATTSGNSFQVEAHDEPWRRCLGMRSMLKRYFCLERAAQTENLD